MPVAGLFAGIGGFERAFERAGFETNFLCDNDPAAQAVLRHRFPAVAIAGDIHEVKRLPRGTEIITAGFPCQNLSMAGDKRGLKGPKSSVVRELVRLVETSNAPTVVIENVYFMLHLAGGAAMGELAKNLKTSATCGLTE